MRKLLVLIIILLIITGCGVFKKDTQPNNMVLTNKKILMVVAPKDFRDEEYLEPKKVLEEAGVLIKVASIKGGIAKGVGGTEIRIDLVVDEANVDEFDAVLFVGGPGMAEMVDNEKLQNLAREFYDKGKLTTAICVAPAILAKAGILKGKNATSWSGVEKDLKENGAHYTAEKVTQDGKLITADGPSSAKEFGEKIVEELKK